MRLKKGRCPAAADGPSSHLLDLFSYWTISLFHACRGPGNGGCALAAAPPSGIRRKEESGRGPDGKKKEKEDQTVAPSRDASGNIGGPCRGRRGAGADLPVFVRSGPLRGAGLAPGRDPVPCRPGERGPAARHLGAVRPRGGQGGGRPVRLPPSRPGRRPGRPPAAQGGPGREAAVDRF